MLGREIFVEVHVLQRQGKSIRAISRQLGISRNTVRRRLRAEQVPVAEIRARKPTKLDDYRGYLQTRIAAARPDWIPASVLKRFKLKASTVVSPRSATTCEP